MKLSVIIPCLNAASTLVHQLDALAAQDYDGEWELLKQAAKLATPLKRNL